MGFKNILTFGILLVLFVHTSYNFCLYFTKQCFRKRIVCQVPKMKGFMQTCTMKNTCLLKITMELTPTNFACNLLSMLYYTINVSDLVNYLLKGPLKNYWRGTKNQTWKMCFWIYACKMETWKLLKLEKKEVSDLPSSKVHFY